MTGWEALFNACILYDGQSMASICRRFLALMDCNPTILP